MIHERKMKTVSSKLIDLAPILAILVYLFFLYPDVVFFGKTLETSQSVASVMPSGQYGYPSEKKVPGITARDPGASAWQYVPLFEFSLQEYHEGRLPLWNPYVGFGAPLAANLQSSAFFLPQVLIAALQGWNFHWDFYLLFRLLIAGLFTYLFCQKINLSRGAALLSSFFFMGNGYFLFFMNMSHLNVEVLIPFFLWAIESFRLRIEKKQSSRVQFLLLALAVFLLVTGGFPKATFFAFAFGALFIVFRFFQNRSQKKWFVHTAAAFGFGILLSSFLLFPFLEYLQNGAAIHTSDTSKSLASFPLSALRTLFFPNSFGSLSNAWMLGKPLMPFINLMVWPLAGMAFFYKKYRPLAFFLGAVGLFYLLKAFGFPLVDWIQKLPIFKLQNFPKYLFAEFAFALSIMAGIGFEFLREKFASLLPERVHGKSMNGGKKEITVLFGGILGLLMIESAFIFWFPRNERFDPFTKPPFVTFLEEQWKKGGPFRIFSADSFLMPNTSSAFQLADIRANDALYPRGYYNFVKENLAPDIYDRFTGQEKTLAPLDNNLWQDLNVRYLIAKPGSRIPQNYPEPWQPVYRGDDAWIFEFPLVRKRAFFLGNDDSKGIQTVTIEKYEPQEIIIQAATEQDDWLMISDIAYPGFRASLDGKKTSLVSAASKQYVWPVRMVRIPNGTHTLKIIYQPNSFRFGLLISLLSLFGIFIYAKLQVKAEGVPSRDELASP